MKPSKASITGKQEYRMGPGEVKTFDASVTINCQGLGSCVGVFLQDSRRGIGGGAHIMLAEDDKGPTGNAMTIRTIIEDLLDQLKQRGSDLHGIRAKIAGGSHSVDPSSGYAGSKNVESVIRTLIDNHIFLAAIDVGGTQNRNVKFDVSSGMLLVRNPENNYYKIF